MSAVLRACAALGALAPLAGVAQTLSEAPRAVELSQGVLPAGYLVNVLVALAVVIATFLGMAWLFKRMGRLSGRNTSDLEVSASLPLGGKERVVIVKAHGEKMLLGISPGGVNLLCRLNVPAVAVSSRTHDAVTPQEPQS